MLVTGVKVHIPAGSSQDWAYAEITFQAEEPASPGPAPDLWEPDAAELLDYVAIENPTTHQKLLYYRSASARFRG